MSVSPFSTDGNVVLVSLAFDSQVSADWLCEALGSGLLDDALSDAVGVAVQQVARECVGLELEPGCRVSLA